MKSILCFGDSNTWGFIPGTGSRFPFTVRWPGLVQAALGSDIRVLEEGLSGRTTVHDDPHTDNRNGRRQLVFLLESHAPLDLVIVMLGTNDLKHRFGLSASDIADANGVLLAQIQTSNAGIAGGPPAALLLSPPLFNPDNGPEWPDFEGATAKSLAFAPRYEETARSHGAAFFDAATVARPSPVDRLHLDASGHRALAHALVPVISGMLGLSTPDCQVLDTPETCDSDGAHPTLNTEGDRVS